LPGITILSPAGVDEYEPQKQAQQENGTIPSHFALLLLLQKTTGKVPKRFPLNERKRAQLPKMLSWRDCAFQDQIEDLRYNGSVRFLL
jgi:hypothetical protein